MRSIIRIFLFSAFFLLTIMIFTGCYLREVETESNDTSNIIDNTTDTIESSEPDISQPQNITAVALQAYLDVLENKNMMCTYTGEKMFFYEHELEQKWITTYTIIDLDNDGTSEMVIFTYTGRGHILYYTQQGDVYCREIYHRTFNSLKIDGTFWRSGSQGDGSISKITFDDEKCTITEVVQRVHDITGNINYFKDGQSISREECESYINIFNQKQEPEWYVYSIEHIRGIVDSVSKNKK